MNIRSRLEKLEAEAKPDEPPLVVIGLASDGRTQYLVHGQVVYEEPDYYQVAQRIDGDLEDI